mgnify:CR=1 FL=1
MGNEILVWTDVASAAVLEPHGRTLIKHAQLEIVVFRHAEKLYALEDRCPHQGASLCIGQIEGGHVKCPSHGLRFRLTDGLLACSAADSAATSMGVRTFPVRVVNGDLQIAMPP